ncbi:tyrosine-type recombinase/integrase [Actinomadura sp. KC345]|uniref:tyrosine-type recombinase/integrase n=1 Tax=Actinomadura sp. KC345 TaxID=2530371 RepID=UPI001FB61F59|nr:tyrosine-type recombinase/integrase [Actinomadura sp. KC345]
MAQYATIRRRHHDKEWEIPQIPRRHRVGEAKVRAALTGGPLPPIRFHDLRHEAATLSLTAGVEMKVVSETLGHARSSFTADVYASVIPQVFKEAAEAAAAAAPRRVGLQRETSGPSI